MHTVKQAYIGLNMCNVRRVQRRETGLVSCGLKSLEGMRFEGDDLGSMVYGIYSVDCVCVCVFLNI